MRSNPEKLKRFTRFFDDDDYDNNDRGFEPLPLASNHENNQSPQRDDATVIGLVTSSTVQADQETVCIPPLHGSLTVKPQLRSDIPIRFGSRWGKYKRVNGRNLGGVVHAVVELPAEEDAYLIRKLSVAKDEVSSFRKRWLSHGNLCRTHEVIEEDSGVLYCVMEPAEVTLRHVCRWPKHNEGQLVAITKQMLDGVSYLTSENLFHSRLNIDNVVINSDGVVKITKLEYCKFDASCSLKNAEAFGRTTMMLMDKYADDQGEITVRPSLEWSETAMDFLSSTRTWTPDDLLKHDFMQQKWTFLYLKLHVSFVLANANMS